MENLSSDIHGDFLREIAIGHSRCHRRNVANLRGQVGCHVIDRVGQIFPLTRHPFDFRLPTENAFRADLARHTRHFRGKGTKLIHHLVDGVLQFKELAAHIDGDFLSEIPICYGRCHCRDIADLRSEVGRHEVHVVRQIFPGAGNAFDFRPAAEFAFRPHFARHARHFRRETAQLLDHRVYDPCRTQKLSLELVAFDPSRHGFGQITLRNRADHPRHFARRTNQIPDQIVDRSDRPGPGVRHLGERRSLCNPAFLSDLASDAFQLLRHALIRSDYVVEGVGDLAGYTRPAVWQAHGKITTLKCR